MQEITYFLELFHALADGIVILCWVVLTAAYFLHKRPPSPPERKREKAWSLGLVLQGFAYLVVWIEPRWKMRSSLPVEFVLDAISMVLAGWAVWIMFAAVPALGRNFGVAARVVEGHKLVTHGPYSRVRHPIFCGMAAMLLATGLALGRFGNLVIGIILFAAGTAIRIASEEKLLRETFPEYGEYAKKVPALLPKRRV